MEVGFGEDLGSVRIHRDARAAKDAKTLDARAFAMGEHIVLPDRIGDDRRLLAHELAHVIQQRRGGSLPTLDPAAAHEREAEAAASAVTAGGAGVYAGRGTGVGIARQHDRHAPPGSRTEPDAAQLLRECARLEAIVAGAIDGHKDLIKTHEEQPIVAAISDYLGAKGGTKSLAIPDLAIWTEPKALLTAVRRRLDDGNVRGAASALREAAKTVTLAYQQLIAYREATIGGAGEAITGLRVAEAVGAIAATIATGGAGAAGGVGLLDTAGVVATGAGVYSEAQEAAGQSGEMIAGTRAAWQFDVGAIVTRGRTEAITAFVATLAGGALSKYAVNYLGSAALAKMAPAQLAGVAKSLGVDAAALTPELFVSAGRRFIVDFLSGVGTAPLTTAVQLAIEQARGSRTPSPQEFASMVMRNAVEGGLVQLFLGALSHGWTAAGPRTGFEPRTGGAGRPPTAQERAPHGPDLAPPAETATTPAPAPPVAETLRSAPPVRETEAPRTKELTANRPPAGTPAAEAAPTPSPSTTLEPAAHPTVDPVKPGAGGGFKGEFEPNAHPAVGPVEPGAGAVTTEKPHVSSSQPVWQGRRHGLDVPAVQAGHRTSRHSGAPEAFAVEDADLNQYSNWTAESKGYITMKDSIIVDGFIVDRPSALLWSGTETGVATGLSRTLVERAPSHPGWVAAPHTANPKAQFMREMLKVLQANPKHPFRFLIDGVQASVQGQ
jgi:hypothetical protein